MRVWVSECVFVYVCAFFYVFHILTVIAKWSNNKVQKPILLLIFLFYSLFRFIFKYSFFPIATQTSNSEFRDRDTIEWFF